MKFNSNCSFSRIRSFWLLLWKISKLQCMAMKAQRIFGGSSFYVCLLSFFGCSKSQTISQQVDSVIFPKAFILEYDREIVNNLQFNQQKNQILSYIAKLTKYFTHWLFILCHLFALTCHSITWIFRILNSINQLAELTTSAAKKNKDIICGQRPRYYNSKLEIKLSLIGIIFEIRLLNVRINFLLIYLFF